MADTQFQSMVTDQLTQIAKSLGGLTKFAEEQRKFNRRQEEFNRKQEEINKKQEETNKKLAMNHDELIFLVEHEVVERLRGISDGIKLYTDQKVRKHEERFHGGRLVNA